MLQEIENDVEITPESDVAGEFREVMNEARVIYPKALLDHMGRILRLADRVYDGSSLTMLLHHWYRLRRILGNSLNVRHFPDGADELELLIRRRPEWPPILADEVASAAGGRGGARRSNIAGQISERIRR